LANAERASVQDGAPINLVNLSGPKFMAVTVPGTEFKAGATTLSPLDLVPLGYRNYCYEGVLRCPDGTARPIRLLRDTGALQSLVSSKSLSSIEVEETGESRQIRSVCGEVQCISLVRVGLHSTLCSGIFLCGSVDTLPPGIDVLVGNDLVPQVSCPVEVCVVTRSQAAKLAAVESEAGVGTSFDNLHAPKVDLESVDEEQNLDLGLQSLFDDTCQGLEFDVSNIHRDQLRQLQRADVELKPLFELVQDQSTAFSSVPAYFLREDILLRTWREHDVPADSPSIQVVVPRMLRAHLLFLAHDIPASGHLGVAKTLARLQRHFYWPAIQRDVREYCRTCDTCQRLGKAGKVPVAPLHSLPVVTEPFTRIAMDIVGPLPICRDTGNRFILTVLDLCTHYPEAIPMPQHTAKDVAKALTSIFSRFGLPREILSDQGSDFMSDLMQVFLNDLHIDQIRTSPYHPQSNGACERFNGTLKVMLKALVEKHPDSWDAAIPWVLFAYREVPVETLGYSPFELMFGRSVVGPLTLRKRQWLGETDLSTAKKSAVEFLLDTRTQLRDALAVAENNAMEQQRKSKTWYDRKARMREFQPGDKVLALLPVAGCPLQAKYHGPYVVVEKLGPVDYVISTPERRKAHRVCHVNLLQEYRQRDPSRFPELTLPDPVLLATTTDPPLVLDEGSKTGPGTYGLELEHLDEGHRVDVEGLLQEFAGVFSDKPGRTNLTIHHIDIAPGTKPIRSAPYRLNPEKAQFLQREIKDLQEQGIIEESASSWASPVVLVPKSDGSLRLCTDFRRVNDVTLADPFPLPRVDDLLDRVGKAKYLTKIDMTRGYWQVPLDDAAVPISAFVTPFGQFQ